MDSAPCIAIALILICRRRRPSECHANPEGVEWKSILPTKLVATATSLEGSKNNFRPDRSSTAEVVPILQISSYRLSVNVMLSNITSSMFFFAVFDQSPLTLWINCIF